MSTVPATVKAPRLPQVNLLPPEVGMRRARGRKRAFAGFILFIFVLALGGAGYLVSIQKAAAEEDLAAAETRNAELQAEAALYSEVPLLKAVLTNAASALAYAGASEIDHAQLREEFEAVLNAAGVELDLLSFSKVGLNTNTAVDVGPFAKADVGSVTFSGNAADPIAVAALTDALEELPWLQHVRIAVTTRALEEVAGETAGGGSGEVIYLYDGSARITFDALTLRFAPEGFVVDATVDQEESAESDEESASEEGDA